MNKTTFVLMAVCLLAGCAGTNSKQNFKVGVQGDEGPPLKVAINNPQLPVEINAQGGKALPVKVEVPKLLLIALIFTAVATLAAFIVAIIACFVAVTAIRSTKAAGRADVNNMARQRNKGNLRSTK